MHELNPDLGRLFRPSILRLKAYQSARSQATEARIQLDANESPWCGEDGSADNRYPEPQAQGILERIGLLYGIDPSYLLLTRGIDEGLDVLFRSVCEPADDNIVIHPPTYGFYETAASLQNCEVRLAPLCREDFALHPDRLLAAMDAKTKIVVICNPNNPTGNAFSQDAMAKVIEGTRGRCLLLVDEAYIELADCPSRIPSVLSEDHVIVMRTFSKAWGLAGARIGVTVARPGIIAILKKVIAPYPLSRPSLRVLAAALQQAAVESNRERVRELRQLRTQLSEALRALPGVGKVYPSATNFILLKVAEPNRLVEALRARGIAIRDRSSEVESCVRISVGSRDENHALLSCMREVLR